MTTLDTPLKPLTKSTTAAFVENVAGIIIGGETVTARLYSKQTRNQVATFSGNNDDECREYAKAWVEGEKMKLGEEYARIYGNMGFELRLWD